MRTERYKLVEAVEEAGAKCHNIRLKMAKLDLKYDKAISKLAEYDELEAT
jgi:hypothetical protein